MKVGDLIEVGAPGDKAQGIIIGVEMLYPGHPQSPVRNVEVNWLTRTPRCAFGAGRRTVNIFSVKRTLSHAHR